ncbi:MAG: hypothetical protein CL912_07410 [Deltaproteobacteria bacterium]|nr:hypothetical protein [Deltaproteobacteria bacterium]
MLSLGTIFYEFDLYFLLVLSYSWKCGFSAFSRVSLLGGLFGTRSRPNFVDLGMKDHSYIYAVYLSLP